MMRDTKSWLAAAALACMATCAGATTCAKPAYPPQSLRKSEEGVSLLGFLIRTDGTVGRSLVLNSSGSKDLDQAAQDAISECTFAPGARDGRPVEMWVAVTYVWSMDSDPGLNQAKQAAESLAASAIPSARYQLGLLLRASARTDAERERADSVLRSAAELGAPHAQYALGRDLELGLNGHSKDVDAAMAWYRKAAGQGDVFAMQRLEKNILSN